MASGSWGTSNNSPWYPATMIGWCKNELGWSNVVEMSDQDADFHRTKLFKSIFRVNHSQVDEE